MKILFCTSEAHPLIKTGGLADVSGSLPAALTRLGHEVHILLPAYRRVLTRLSCVRLIANIELPGRPERARILESSMPDSEVTVWLVDSPDLFDRDGNPYTGPDGNDWPDNALRFATFARVARKLALDRAGIGWRPDVVHGNDWQTGLIPALLAREETRPATVFTIHNLAYQGVFPREDFSSLGLPENLWSPAALEFYGNFSFIKGGLVFADRVTTVSPTYAEEIRRPEFGYGLEGLLNYRADRLTGILNGVDYHAWDPQHDRYLVKRYGPDNLKDKQASKAALQAHFSLPVTPRVPLLGLVGRLVSQKGIDIVADAVPALMERGVQLVVLGTGERAFHDRLRALAHHYPEQIGLHLGYSEELAHQVEGGADLFLMPSRFEPCGLNQIYSLRYGTLPVVRRTGGLADTVVDATEEAVAAGRATGFVFDNSDAAGLLLAVDEALAVYRDSDAWQRMMRTAMNQDFSWERSAAQYVALYHQALADAGYL